jgi:dTDP-4-dehydrorhamnose 3,5-epimerase
VRIFETSLADVVVLESAISEDSPGFPADCFDEHMFHATLRAAGLSIPQSLILDSHIHLNGGMLRGLNYQLPPHAQGNLIRTFSGSAYVAAVDMRRGSMTFGKWAGVELRGDNPNMLWIPQGFAHGYIALEDNTHIQVRKTHRDNTEFQRKIRWNDAAIDINWPKLAEIHVSKEDAVAPQFVNSEPHSEFLHGTTEPVELKIIGDERGSLVAIEPGLNIPFEIKRVYYIYGTLPDVGRGFHAHRRLEQMAICVAGSCIMVIDDGVTRQEVKLESANKALLIRNMIWREMHEFSDDCVLLVLASEYYDESDYIRDYEQFIQEVNDGKK